jgi:hypothetical protein
VRPTGILPVVLKETPRLEVCLPHSQDGCVPGVVEMTPERRYSENFLWEISGILKSAN